jgi:hypothetical protein
MVGLRTGVMMRKSHVDSAEAGRDLLSHCHEPPHRRRQSRMASKGGMDTSYLRPADGIRLSPDHRRVVYFRFRDLGLVRSRGAVMATTI